jgi:hypothetical protein
MMWYVSTVLTALAMLAASTTAAALELSPGPCAGG